MARIDTLSHFLTDVADAIRNKKGSSGTIQASSFDTEIASIPSGGGGAVEKKDINFYDYDGTILHSYTKSEFNNLETMPDNPTHEGLTSMGWNWTLQEGKDYLVDHNYIEIGQVYQLSDASIKLFVSLDKYTLNPYVTFAVNGTATIDWGDNTTSSVTGTSASTMIDTSHTYSSGGVYVIKISSTSDIRLPSGSTSYGNKLLWSGEDNSNSNSLYNRDIIKIFLNNNVVMSNAYTFVGCVYLESIILPNNSATLGNNLFNGCSKLKHITIPKQTNYVLSQYCFQYCYCLQSISLSSTIQRINQNCFYYCYNLKRVTMPNNLTTFSSSLFDACYITELEMPNSAYNYSNGSFKNLSYVKKIVINNTSSLIFNTSAFSQSGFREFIVKGKISSIYANAFYLAYSCRKYDFRGCTSIPTLDNKNAFTGINTNCKIIVPDSLYENWITANNWSNYSSNIVKVSDYNEE